MIPGDVVDQGGTIDAATIQILKKGFGRAAILEICRNWRVALHQFKRCGLKSSIGAMWTWQSVIKNSS